MSHSSGMQTQDARIASFETIRPKGKKRTSSAKNKKGKFTWSLTSPSIEQLAQAGFFYSPTDQSDDNVTCFYCSKSLNQWEEGDDAFKEHLAAVPDCAWAVVTAVERNIIVPDEEHDPLAEEFLEARKATFGTAWPFENERGWTPKVQKLAEAGWHYFPSPESNDYTKCAYCSLCLDGWEPKDKPVDEHKRRSPDCSFFTLANLHKKTRKSKKARASKASRASVQSVATATHDDSALDLSAQPDDSILTTATDMTTASTATSGAQKGGRAKKGTAKTGARSTRAKKTEESSVVEPEPAEYSIEVVAPAVPKRTRGRKRSTAEMQVDEAEEDLAAPPRKRMTRARASTAQSMADSEQSITKDTTMADNEPEEIAMPKRGGKKRGTAGSRTASRTTSGTRKVSARTASATSHVLKAPARQPILDEGEIDAMLEADLERDMSDEEMPDLHIAAESDSEPEVEPEAKPKAKRAPRAKATSKAPSRSATHKASDALVESDTKETQSQDVLAAFPHPPNETAKRTTAKATTRKATKGSTADDAKESQDILTAPSITENVEDSDDSVIIRHANKMFVDPYQDLNSPEDDNDMVVEEPQPAKGQSQTKKGTSKATVAKGKKDKTSKKGIQEAANTTHLENEISRQHSETKEEEKEQSKDSHDDDLRFSSSFEHEPSLLEEAEVPVALVEHFSPKKAAPVPEPGKAVKAVKAKTAKAQKKTASQPERTKEAESAIVNEEAAVAKSVKIPAPSPVRSPVHHVPHSASRSPRQAAPGGFPSPTPSPQSSNAENEQPSARPTHTRPPLAPLTPSHAKPTATRLVLAAEATTPTRSICKDRADQSVSPQWALKSSFQWRPVDIEAVFLGSPKSKRAKWFGPANQDKENRSPLKTTVKDMQGVLTTPEKGMTVEEWIKSNAEKGEERLKAECERVVSQFEIKVLEH